MFLVFGLCGCIPGHFWFGSLTMAAAIMRNNTPLSSYITNAAVRAFVRARARGKERSSCASPSARTSAIAAKLPGGRLLASCEISDDANYTVSIAQNVCTYVEQRFADFGREKLADGPGGRSCRNGGTCVCRVVTELRRHSLGQSSLS